ncbi:MAG: hypothetical protein U0441_27665 [Polyangiaceae bacterium]
MRFTKQMVLIGWVGLLAGCGGVVVDSDPAEDQTTLGASEARWSFEMPEDGTPNNNGFVGPFCCTGKTAVVKADDGAELGYAYFYDWKGQAYLTGEDSSMAPDVTIHVAGLTDIVTPSKTLEKADISFTADELVAGTSRAAQAGALVFTVTVEHAELSTGPGDLTYFDMGSLTVRIDVDPASGQ